MTWNPLSWGRTELHKILADISDTVTRLETYVQNKNLELAEHYEEIALHQTHITVKTADAERAKRIRDRLTELLA